jgi:prepilin signal peptidase PulO-like enzyme (type II secretory pathway)
MTPRRSKPLVIAPLIPLLGIAGFIGVDRLQHTRYLAPFVVVWCLLFAALFIYIAARTLKARRVWGRASNSQS